MQIAAVFVAQLPIACTDLQATRPWEEPVSTMTAQATPAVPAKPAAPDGPRHRRVRLPAGMPAAHATAAVRAVIDEWQVPVDRSLAAVLASDLVINAVTNSTGETFMLSIRCTGSQFRVEAHDASFTGDSWESAESGADAERGLLLAAALAAGSGHYRTPAGRAVFYTLEFAPAAATGGGHTPRGAAGGDREP